MKFNFATANRIIFGEGMISSLKEIVGAYGKKVLIIKGKEKPNPDILFSICKESDLEWVCFDVIKEPDIETVNQAAELGQQKNCEFVIGFGGGSVIDSGKAVAALLNNQGSLMDYLEVVGKGKPLKNYSKPYIAIPTTAGTGSEVTRNAVIAVPEQNVKVSMRNAYLLPEVAIIDPELTYEVPKNITATTGMDAFTQVLEPYVSKNNNPLVDLFCREAIPIGAIYLKRSWEDGNDIKARGKMAWVSLLGGLALANAKLGAVHGFAGSIGGMFNVPHGSVCAALLASVFSVNVKALSKHDNSAELISRYSDIAKWITGHERASISDGVEWLANLSKELGIPSLSHLGIKRSDFQMIIEKSKNSSSMKGNPVQLTDEELENILDLSY
jgi:alcohol dehydrogenase class IV